AIGQTVQSGGLGGGDGGGDDPGAQRHQELEMPGHRNQRSGYQPGVLAGAAGGDEHAAVAELVGGLGDLLQIAVIHGAGALGGAQIATVAVGGQEPENVQTHGWSP